MQKKQFPKDGERRVISWSNDKKNNRITLKPFITTGCVKKKNSIWKCLTGFGIFNKAYEIWLHTDIGHVLSRTMIVRVVLGTRVRQKYLKVTVFIYFDN